MHLPTSRQRFFHPASRIVTAAALVLASSHAAQAATNLWIGNTSANWSEATNWSLNTPPADFDDLAFGATGTAGPILNNNLTEGLNIFGLAFNPGASAFTLNGNGISLVGPVANNSTVLQTINLPLALSAQQTFTTTAGGGDLTLGGVISGFGGITKANAGTGTAGILRLTNPANTYTGETVFGAGITNVATLADYGVASSLGARTTADENGTVTGISLHFLGGTLQYTGSTPQSTNRQIRVLNGPAGGTIDASGTTPEATLSFTHTGPNINLFDTGGTRTITLTGTNTGNNSFSIQLTNQAAAQTSLQKTGTGKWMILNSDNTYTGETIIGGGILNVASLSDYGVASSIGQRSLAEENATVTGISLHFRGGTLQYTGSTPQSTNRQIRMLNGNGATIDASGSTPEATLSFTKTGANINLFDTGGTRTLTLTGTNTGNNTFSIQLSNQSTNATGLTKTGPGRWILNGPDSNTGTGATTVNGGTLVLGKTNATAASGNVVIGDGVGTDVLLISGTGGNQIADSSVVTLNGTGADAGILRLGGLNETIAGLIGAGIVENESGAAGTSTLTVNVAGSSTFSGLLRNGDGAGTDGTLALTKSGAGTLVLAGTSTHTGATTVSAGTLTVNGTLGADTPVSVTNATLNGTGTVASAVNVGTGGVVSGTGTFTGTVNLANGSVLSGTSTLATVIAGSGSRISPGAGNLAATLNIGSLTLTSGSLLDFELGASSDLVNVTGAGGLALNGGAFNVFESGGSLPLITNGSYTLLDYNTNFTGSLANLSIANSQVGKFYSLTNDTAATTIKLTVADAVTTEWNGAGGNNLWSTAGNWTNGVPNNPGAVAKFGTIPTAPTTIAVSGPKTVGGMLFDNTNPYTVSGGAADVITLDNGVAAASLTVNSGSHTIAAPLVLVTSANATTAAGTTLRLTGNISGSRGLITSGSGTTIVTGTNSFTTTTVGGGTLQIGEGGTAGTLGSGDIAISNGAALILNRSDDLALANNISGSGAQVTKLGAGTLTLSGNNTFSTANGSGFNLNGGTVKLASPTALGTGVVLGFNGGTLDLNGNSVTSSFLAGSSGTITDTGAGAGTSNFTLNQSANTTFAGTILSGATRTVSLTKAGAGVLTLTGNNTFSGPLTITNGTVIAAGTGGNKPIVSNITLGDNSNAVTLIAGTPDQQFGPATVLTFDNGSRNAKFQLRGSSQTLAGIDASADSSVTLAIIQNDEVGSPGFTVAPGPATLTLNTTTDHSFTGFIRAQSGGGISLVKEGAATQEIRNALIGTNVIAGATVNAGKLRFSYTPNGLNTNTFASGTAASGSQPVNLVTNVGGTLAFAGTITVPGQTVDGSGVVTAVGATITNAGTVLSEGSNVVTINSPITGAGSVVIAGTGTTTLGGANSFTGDVVLNSGILGVGNNQALGDSTARVIINGGNLRAAGATREIFNPVTVNGSFTLGRQTNLNSGLTLTADATITADNPDGTFNTTSALGPVSGPFRLTIQQGAFGMGAGAIIINGENSNSGGTTISSGRVNVSGTGFLAGGDLVVNGGELNLGNTAQTVTRLSGAGGTLNLQFGTLTVNQASDTTFAGALGNGGALVKKGAGSLTLSGAGTGFFGTATANEGTLLVNGSINGTATVDGATAVLGGSGSMSSITALNGGTVSPGGSGTGILSSLSDFTMSSGTKLRLELNSPVLGTGYDQLSAFGTVNLGDATLSLGGSYTPATAGDLFFVIANEGFSPVLGTFAGLAEGSSVFSSSGAQFSLTYLADSAAGTFTGGNDVALRAIPEPGTGALLLASAGALLGLRRRRAVAA